MRGKVLLLLSIFLIINSVSGQVIFRAYSDARQVIPGHYFQVSFTLENAKGSGFKAPSFLDFDVVGGPSTSSQISIVNGQRSQKMTYTYSLTADKIGTFTIGAAEIKANGQTYKTDPITIEVVKGKPANTNDPAQMTDAGGGIILLEASLEYDTAYVGQQLILRYDIITNLDVRSSVISKAPEFDGFFAQELQGANVRSERIVRDGVQYLRRPIKIYALFPQQKGVFRIEPAQAVSGISDGSRPTNFFFTRRLKQIRSISDPITITVQDLPKPAPISFSGAVGQFRMNAAIDKKRITLDDAVTLTMQIQGSGDGKFIEAPHQSFENEWDVYDPNLLNENQRVIGGEIRNTKAFEYLMIPKNVGRQTLVAEFTYYDVDSAKYITLRTNPMQITVLQSSGRELADIKDEKLVLAPIYMKSNLKKDNRTFAFSPVHIGINGLIGLSALGLILIKRRQIQKSNIDPEILRREKAQQLAIEKLADAKNALDNNKIEAFYIQLRQALTTYLSDKTGRKTDQLSKNDIEDLLKEHHLEVHGEAIQQIMQKGEQALYAAIRPGSETETYQKTKQIIFDIEASLTT